MLKLQCKAHGMEIDEHGRCEKCSEVTRQNYTDLQERYGANITVALPIGPTEFMLGGETISRFHHSGYIEYSVPSELEEEINKFIEEKISAYEATCKCLECRKQRGELKAA